MSELGENWNAAFSQHVQNWTNALKGESGSTASSDPSSESDQNESEYSSAMQAAIEALKSGASQYSVDEMKDFYEYLRDLGREEQAYNLAKYPELSQQAMSVARGAAEGIQGFVSEGLQSIYDRYLPEWREAVSSFAQLPKTLANMSTAYLEGNYPEIAAQQHKLALAVGDRAAEYLTGAIPKDLLRQIETRMSEAANRAGLPGQSATSALLARLNDASQQTVQLGANLAGVSSGLASSNQALLSNAFQIAGAPTAAWGNYLSVGSGLATPEISSLGNLASLYSGNLQTLTGVALNTPGNIMQLGQNLYGTNVNANVQLTGTMAGAMSQQASDILNYRSDIMGMNMQLQAAQQYQRANARAQSSGAMSSLFGGLGYAFGGPVGGLIGGSFGGLFG